MNLLELTWPMVRSLSPDTPVVFPVAALEQHGRHMPLFTDSLLMAEVVRRVAERSPYREQVLFAPLQWLGNSDHHLDFAGTLSAPPRTYLDMLSGLLDNFVMHGFRRLLIINGHGGNDVPGKQVVFEMRQKYRHRDDIAFVFATYWNLGGKPRDFDPSLQQDSMGHACEWETSMMLRIRPELVVGDPGTLEDVPFEIPFEPASKGWVTRERTRPGHIGKPRFSTADKGESLFRVFSDDFARLLDAMLAWDGRSQVR